MLRNRDNLEDLFIKASRRESHLYVFGVKFENFWNIGMTPKEIYNRNLDDGIDNFKEYLIGGRKEMWVTTENLERALCGVNICKTYVQTDEAISRMNNNYVEKPNFLSSWRRLHFDLISKDAGQYHVYVK